MLSSLANNDQCNAVPGSSESMLHSYHFLVATYKTDGCIFDGFLSHSGDRTKMTVIPDRNVSL